MRVNREKKCPHTSTSQIVDMYSWIFNQHDSNCPQDTKDGIGCYQYIFHVGDIVDGDGGDDVMWPAATDIFTKIATNNEKEVPFGFATGNHDYRSSTGNNPGQGVYKPGNYDKAKNFLQTIYKLQPDYGPQFITDKNGVPISPFLSYKNFSIGNVKFIALNVPLGLPEIDSEFQATKDFIANNKDALIILNSHTFDAWGSAPDNGKLADLYLKNKNVFKVLWGHDPGQVNSQGGFTPIPSQIISRGSNIPDAFKYRFDYQEGAPYNCNGNNMPQHPLIRIYSFSLDETNKTLTWQAYDVQSWNPSNQVYASPAWANAKDRINHGQDVTPLGAKVAITISNYISQKASY